MSSAASFPKPFSIRIERPDEKVLILAIAGEIDRARNLAVHGAFQAAINDPDQPAVILDLTELDFIDSWGLNSAFDTARALRDRDGTQLIVAGSGMQVKRVFSIIHIARVVRLVDDVDEAVAEAIRAHSPKPSSLSA